MKKILVVLIALLALTAFVACSSDPVKNNLAIGKWQYKTFIPEEGELTIDLEVKSDKTAILTRSVGSESISVTGTWTATSTSEGTITFMSETETFKATSSTLTISGGIVFTKK